jgi:hypothetical protein
MSGEPCTLKVKDLDLAVRLLVEWFCENIDPELAPQMAGALLSQGAFVAHRLGVPREMFLRLAATAYPSEKGPTYAVGLRGHDKRDIGANAYNLAERWLK